MKHKNTLLVVFFLTLFVSQQVQAGATTPFAEKPLQINAPASANILFSTFHVYVYKLVPPTEINSGSILPSHELCTYNDINNPNSYGCGSELPYSGDPQNPNNQDTVKLFFYVDSDYYLKNVLPNEMDFAKISPELEALKAQTVAARTVASWKSVWDQTYGDLAIDNSTAFQVFIPGTFNDYLNYQADVNTALNVTSGQFLSAGDGHTIDAEFGSEAGSQTEPEPGKTYMITVQEPNFNPNYGKTRNYLGKGMSQRGAIRWAKGNTCPEGTGSTWPTNSTSPIKWDYKQILAHYYTGVDFMNDTTSSKVAPDDRWNLLNYASPACHSARSEESSETLRFAQGDNFHPDSAYIRAYKSKSQKEQH
jgi:hypothetical protein